MSISDITLIKVAVSFVFLGASIGVAFVGNSWISGILRNPEGAGKAFLPAFVIVGFMEISILFSIAIIFALK